MIALIRLALAAVLLVSSSLAVAAMAAEGTTAHTEVAGHAAGHAHHEQGGQETDHDGLDCSTALCCFALAAADVVEPPKCPLTSPWPGTIVLSLPAYPDPHERPPQQV